MKNSGADSTQPIGGADTQPTRVPEAMPAPRGRRSWVWVVGLLIGLIVLVLAGGYSGYTSGIQARFALDAARVSQEIDDQFLLGVEDFNARAYDRARQRFEWVIAQNPNHSGAIEMLAQTLAVIQATATPTVPAPTATPAPTPTPDLREVEEIFSQAQASLAEGDWDAAIEGLLNLRKRDPAFHAVDIDSMLYVAYRNRGVDKILVLGDLEGGLFDLSQVALFGPLDSEAKGYASWARFYRIGASFWGVDWGQAAFYFGQVAPFAPNLHDGTNWTAMERYLEALTNYINELVEDSQWCLAAEQLDIYRQYVDSPDLEQQQTRYDNRCEEDENG